MLRSLALASLLLLVTAATVVAEHPPTSTVTLTVSGMYCSGCASGIRAILKRTEGVLTADVSYEDRQAVVEYDREDVGGEDHRSDRETRIQGGGQGVARAVASHVK